MVELPPIPHLTQYFGPMLIHEPAVVDLLNYVNRMDFSAHFARVQESGGRVGGDPGYQITAGGVAVFDIEGPLTKYGSSLSSAPSMIELRRQIRMAANDPGAEAILLRIDSPGGTYAGAGDLAREIRTANEQKPVHAYIEDMGCSGAYWIASQCEKITANPGAMVGSIGTYTTITDSSRAAGKAGLVVHVIGTGEFKGAGTPGTKLTDAQREDAIRVVEEINEVFLESVAEGRGMALDDVREIATGQVHEAQKAMALGLVDEIGTLDQALSALAGGEDTATTKESDMRKNRGRMSIRSKAREDEERTEDDEQVEDDEERTQEDDEQVNEDEDRTEEDEETSEDEEQAEDREKKMRRAKGKDKGKPATLSQLKSAIPGSDAEFREQCMEHGLSLASAKDLWTDTLQARLENRDEELAALRKRPGNKALSPKSKARASATADPIAQWNTRVGQLTDKGKTKPEAIRTLVREEPELHKAYLEAYNANL